VEGVRPIVLHANFVIGMLPLYELLADSHFYEMSAHGTPLPGVVSATFVRHEPPECTSAA
jgi:hypothetical protein